MKRFCFLLITSLAQWCAWAQFVTPGNGNTYTLQKLTTIAESGVESEECDGPREEQNTCYRLTQSVTIARGDRFVLDEDASIVEFASGTELSIEGEASFEADVETVFNATYQGGTPKGVFLNAPTGAVKFCNITFRQVGLRVSETTLLEISHCNFFNHNGSAAAALYFVLGTTQAKVNSCRFEACQRAAIGSSVTASALIACDSCTLYQNSAQNQNVPQINLSASPSIAITNCTVAGNPLNNLVGGIGISNFTATTDTDIRIEGCTIADNRYGIGTVGPVNIVIFNNQLLNNRYETNPMNGGSGVSLYDPYVKTCARLTGNTIEGSLWGVTIIGCKEVNLGRTEVPTDDEAYNPGGNIFKDNGNGGVLYDLYNNSTITVYAQGNTWNVEQQTSDYIEGVITHKHDNASLGEVIFWPAAGEVNSISNTRYGTTVLNSSGVCFDLLGRKRTVSQSGIKGIGIVNGKKILIR